MRFWMTVAITSALLFNSAYGSDGSKAVRWLEKQGWVRDSIVDTRGKLSRVYTREVNGKNQWLTCPLKQNCDSGNTDDCIVISKCKITNSEMKANTENPNTRTFRVAPSEEHAIVTSYSTLDNRAAIDRLKEGITGACEVKDIAGILDPEKVRVQVDSIINSVLIEDIDHRSLYSCFLSDDDRCAEAVSEGKYFKECIETNWCVRYQKPGDKGCP